MGGPQARMWPAAADRRQLSGASPAARFVGRWGRSGWGPKFGAPQERDVGRDTSVPFSDRCAN